VAHPPLSIISENDAAADVSRPPAETVSSPPRRRSRWPASIFILLVLFWVGDTGITLLIQHSNLRRRITTSLTAALGRPVQVDRYDFSLWNGPTLEAKSVTVEEDPRFGREYFMRAESLQVRLRWQGLLRGHLELGTLSLTGPSLNIVRNAGGDWNLAEWLPRPPATGPQTFPATPIRAMRFSRIEVQDGRVNFKRSDQKLPFALVDVKGVVDTDVPGRWRLDLEATPWRASIVTQQAGTLHVSGRVGGTSSRLLPAALDAAWTDASVSDVLRLARGDDYGIRGTLGLVISANAQGADWNLRSRAEFRQLHRWDLAVRNDDPSLNFAAEMKWNPQEGFLELTQGTLEAPRSNARVSGKIAWVGAKETQKDSASPVAVTISDSIVDLNDVLAWVRAFRSGVSDGISVHGFAVATGSALGWPPHLQQGTITTSGVDLSGQGLLSPVRLGPAEVHFDQGRVSFPPATLSFDPSAGSILVEASVKNSTKRTVSLLHVAGNLNQLRDLTSMAGAFGFNLSRGWDVAGPFRCDLRWQGSDKPWLVQPIGFVELGSAGGSSGGASLHAPFLNQAVSGVRVRADLKPGLRHVALSSAAAFGAVWNGTFDRRASDDEWKFALSADHVASSDLDLWLNPRWRESFLDRVLPFLNSRQAAIAIPENLRAAGRLRIDRFTLAPFVLNAFQGDVNVAGRHIEVANASSQFYGGKVSGSFIAELNAVPSYRAVANFAALDLSSIAAASPQLAGLFSGSATGDISFVARGATRADLMSSLECEGSAAVQSSQLFNIDLFAGLRGEAFHARPGLFRQASASFKCEDRAIQIQNLSLLGAEGQIEGQGTVDFSRNLSLQLSLQPESLANDVPVADNSPAHGKTAYQLTGSLASPQLTPLTPPRRAR
jgi:hypothetical protein